MINNNLPRRLIPTKVPGYARDPRNHSLINTNNDAYKTYMKLRDEKLKVKNLTEQVDSLQSQFDEMKNLLQTLVNKG
jgi:uncharacterized coiled-coil DUF342 family protein